MDISRVTVREGREGDKRRVADIFSEAFSGSWRYWSIRLLDVLKLIVAEVGGEVVGAAELYTTEVKEFGRVGVISFIAVEKRFRGRGIGKELVKAAEKLFEKMGCAFAAASTRSSNEASLNLFRSLGYELHWRGSRVFESLEAPLYAYEDDVIMLKPLRTVRDEGEAHRYSER